MWKTLLLQYALKGLAKGVGALGVVVAAKYGVDQDTIGAVQGGLIAAGGYAINEAVDWYQKNRMVKKSESNTAKIEIVAEAVNVPIPTVTIPIKPATAPTTAVDGEKPVGTTEQKPEKWGH